MKYQCDRCKKLEQQWLPLLKRLAIAVFRRIFRRIFRRKVKLKPYLTQRDLEAAMPRLWCSACKTYIPKEDVFFEPMRELGLVAHIKCHDSVCTKKFSLIELMMGQCCRDILDNRYTNWQPDPQPPKRPKPLTPDKWRFL